MPAAGYLRRSLGNRVQSFPEGALHPPSFVLCYCLQSKLTGAARSKLRAQCRLNGELSAGRMEYPAVCLLHPAVNDPQYEAFRLLALQLYAILLRKGGFSMSENARFPILTAAYWRQAAAMLRNTHMLVFAALIVALRVAVKFARIPVAAGVSLTLDCYVNSLGSLVYGPVVGLAVGAVSDTLGCLIAPNGPYFFPFILVEMSSSFLFGLFFWRQRITVPRILAAKFTVNLFSNIVLNSLMIKWSYTVFYGAEKAYSLINLSRIAKNLVVFPLEAAVIAIVFSAAMPALRSLGLVDREDTPRLTARHALLIAGLTVCSAALVLFYIFFLRDFIAAHNITKL